MNPNYDYTINRAQRPGEAYKTMIIRASDGRELAEYRLTHGRENAEIAAMRRAINKHLAKPGSTLGNYGW